MCTNDCQRLAPSTSAASWTSWSRPSMRGQQDDEHERRPLPRVADDHGGASEPRVGDPGEVPQAELDPQRLEGALRRVGHHQEHVADADRRDRQRDQEHDPEELAPRHLLDGQQREAESERVLERDPDEHEDQGDDQRARAAAVAEQRLHQEVDEADQQEAGEQAQQEPEGPVPAAADRPGPGDGDQHDRRADDQPADQVGRLEHAQEVAALEAEQQLLVVREPDELEVDAALAEREPREREGDRRDQREQRQAQDDDDGRPDEQPPGRAVGAKRAERRGRSARDAAGGASAGRQGWRCTQRAAGPCLPRR